MAGSGVGRKEARKKKLSVWHPLFVRREPLHFRFSGAQTNTVLRVPFRKNRIILEI